MLRDSPIGRSMAATDWSATAIGPVADWSPTLRTTASICLETRFPMLVMWGPELAMFYNDAYAPMLGGRHPAALGQPVSEVWADVWPSISGLLSRVMDGGEATYDEDLLLVTSRRGFEEETYFTFSYSPVRTPDGEIGGVLDTATETTPRVLGTRRLAALQQLGGIRSPRHADVEAACAAAMEVLAEHRADLPFGLVYLLTDDRAGARRVAYYGLGDAGIMPESLPTPAVGSTIWRAVTAGEVMISTGLAERLPGLSRPGGSPAGDADVHTAVALPLIVSGIPEPVGALVVGTSPYLRLDADYQAFLELVAGQVCAVVTETQAFEAERRRAEEQLEHQTTVALTLQRSILGPSTLPVEFAVRYEPAARGLEVGGDWYDVVPLPDDRYGVVVGDVVGRGLAAAAVMGQLRSAARAMLLGDGAPADVLSALDTFAALLPGARCTTVFCAVVDPGTRMLRYSSAGHPPAILVDPGGTHALLEQAQAPPLAVVAGLRRPEAATPLPPGSTLLLYTDGLVERRGESIDAGMDRAAATVVEGGGLAPCDLADLLAARLLDGGHFDDVAFLVYRQPRGTPLPEPFSVSFPAAASRLAGVRRDLRGWLQSADLDRETVDDLVLAAGEAAANAVEHGAGLDPAEIVSVDAALLPGGVVVTVRDTGRWIPPDPRPTYRGRGLTMMRALTDDVEIDTAPGGTTVRMHRRTAG